MFSVNHGWAIGFGWATHMAGGVACVRSLLYFMNRNQHSNHPGSEIRPAC